MTPPRFTLISHHLCPYVQRAAIALQELGIPFERRNIDLTNKPDWFLKLSPLGKVPLLLVDDKTVLFESSIIAEYINDVANGNLFLIDPLERARQRAWIEFASSTISNIGQLYNAVSDHALEIAHAALTEKWQALETNISDQRWFSGADFSLVDAAFAPVFRYFDVIEPLTSIDFFANVPKVRRWRANLAARTSVQTAVDHDYNYRLTEFLAERDSVIAKLAQLTFAPAA